MSIRIDKNKLTLQEVEKIKLDCYVVAVANEYGPPTGIQTCGETANALYIPFAYYKKWFEPIPTKLDNKTLYNFNEKKYPFRTDGGRDQKKVFEEALQIVGKYGSVLLSLFCAFGKTYLAIRLAHNLGEKTAILTHRAILMDQWADSISKFTSARFQRVGTNGSIDKEADFYVFNIAYVHKRWNKEKKTWEPKKVGSLKNIGTLIIDEAHIVCAEEISKALHYFSPKYAIALTATPERKDGLDKVLELYFGEYSLTRIVRTSKNPFIVYRFFTNIKPEFNTNKFGKKNWNSVIDYFTNSKERNDMIISIIQKFRENNILVLTKRKNHCKNLSKMLTELYISNSVMTGTESTYDKEANVLLSTYSKLGVGFDDTRLNMLIVACSVMEIEQYAGRLRDGVNKKRIIVDMVDSDGNCINHWKKRKEWYISRGGIIREYQEKKQIQEMPKRLARKI